MNGNDKYCVKKDMNFQENYQRVISLLYMPLITPMATSLYFYFAQQRENEYYSLEMICSIMDIGIDELEKDIIALENFGLLKTLKNNSVYMLCVHNPLSYQEFFNHPIYPRLLHKQVGEGYYALLKAEVNDASISMDGFEDVTHSLDKEILTSWNQQNEDDYQKSNLPESYENVVIDFDYNEMLRNCTDLQFPQSLRTKENMIAIGKLATIFSISPARMKTLACQAIDKKTKIFDIEKLRSKCISEKSTDTKDGKFDYSIEPVNFLYQKQGFALSSVDKKTIEYLKTELNLNNEVVNFLVEYILDNNDNMLSTALLEKIGSTWARQGIDTIEKAKQQITKQPLKKKQSFTKAEMEVEEQDIEELRKKLFAGQ